MDNSVPVNADDLKSLLHGSAEVLAVTKRLAARSQLETAIQLWFHDGDPISIHTLVVAACDCLNALHKHTKSGPSYFEEWLALKPKSIQKQMKVAQNFLKHGHNELNSTLELPTIQAEMMMMDAVNSYEAIGEKPTALMRLYTHRFCYEQPYLITKDALPLFIKNAEVHQLANTTRNQFFQKLLLIFIARYESSKPDSTSPA